jgi:hypothetical protein
MAEVNYVKHAMHVLNEAINEDDGPGSYRDSWKANLACAIHDGFNSEQYNLGTVENPQWIGVPLDSNPQWIGVPLDSTKFEDCEEIADRFLKMLFHPNQVKK